MIENFTIEYKRPSDYELDREVWHVHNWGQRWNLEWAGTDIETPPSQLAKRTMFERCNICGAIR